MSDPRRQLPSIDALLAGPGVAALLAEHPRALVLKAARAAVDAARVSGGGAPAEGWDAAVEAAVLRLAVPSLAPVINATGVVLHTTSAARRSPRQRLPRSRAWRRATRRSSTTSTAARAI